MLKGRKSLSAERCDDDASDTCDPQPRRLTQERGQMQMTINITHFLQRVLVPAKINTVLHSPTTESLLAHKVCPL